MYAKRLLSIICIALATMLISELALAQSTDNAKPITARMEAAKSDFDAGRYAEAAQQYRQIVALDPNSAQAWYLLGQALGKPVDPKGAQRAYERALQLQPQGQMADLARKALVGIHLQDCADCPEMVMIPAGKHTLFGDELKQASISLSGFALGKTPVTQGQWKAIMGSNPSNFTSCGDTCPVENVSWDDAQDYIRRLSQKTGQSYRLPSEAEWEYACMAGNTTTYCGGDDLGSVAWYNKNSGNTPHPVATKLPNGFGLYNMSGNVWEWTRDCWQENCNFGRVLRGGSWAGDQGFTRAANRQWYVASFRYDIIGFRVARAVP